VTAAMNENGNNGHHSLTVLLNRIGAGDGQARWQLWARVAQEVRLIAESRLRTEAKAVRPTATSVVDETYLRLFKKGDPDFENRAHFFGAVAWIVQEILIGEARRRGRGRPFVPIEDLDAIVFEKPVGQWSQEDIDALKSALDRLAGDVRHTRKAAILRMHYIVGLPLEEIAGTLGVSRDTVKRDLRLGRAWLYHELTKGGARA
jgi:RNA polymerase sigma factor (TIGR02999 family)